jgi:hypothetical protein
MKIFYIGFSFCLALITAGILLALDAAKGPKRPKPPTLEQRVSELERALTNEVAQSIIRIHASQLQMIEVQTNHAFVLNLLMQETAQRLNAAKRLHP